MKKRTRTVLTIILVVIAAACIVYIVHYFTSQKEKEKVYEEVQKQVELKPEKEPEEKAPEEPKEKNPIDFQKLKETNEDIYAWISIPDTNINYPVVQSSWDNTYYLDHTIEGQAGLPGSIYTENYNARDFSDFNTVIYGHDMKDGSMFQNLHNYEDPSYMKDHPKVYVYTPEKLFTYEIFAAVVYDDRHILMSFDFTQENQKQTFLDSLKSVRDLSSNFNEEVEVGPDSHIITMSTCIASQPDHRFIVGAVLTDEYEYGEQ